LGNTYPFIFSACILLAGLFDYIVKHQSVLYRRRMDDVVLGVAEVVKHSSRSDELIPHIQKRISDFLEAERSTVYLWDEKDPTPCLKAHSFLGSSAARPMIRERIELKQGIIGYVCESKAPLLIWNLASDVRFQGHLQARGSQAQTYKTGSCMLFPLIVGERLVGVLTIADRKDQRPFTSHDFSLSQVIAKDLAMVIHTRALIDSLGRQFSAA
jgi:transcriptional regulator with GAF, ATPase, and Fis domain